MRNSSNLVWADFQGFSCHMEGEGIETGENKKAPGGRVKEYILGLYCDLIEHLFLGIMNMIGMITTKLNVKTISLMKSIQFCIQ